MHASDSESILSPHTHTSEHDTHSNSYTQIWLEPLNLLYRCLIAHKASTQLVPLLAPCDEGLQVMQAWTSGVKPTLIAADCACLWLTPELCAQSVASSRYLLPCAK